VNFAGNYDVIQEPENISEIAKKHIPFYMFIDEETEEYMRNKSILNSSKRVGLWRIIVVRNVPYNDARRNGKVLFLKKNCCCYFALCGNLVALHLGKKPN